MGVATLGKARAWVWIGSVGLAVAMASVVAVLLLLNTHAVSTGSINISPRDYKQAQARWAAQHIVVYEIDVRYSAAGGCGLGSDGMMCGTWTLHVDSDANTVVALAHDYGVANSEMHFLDATTRVVAGKEMDRLTVDGLFARIQTILDEGPFDVRGTLIDYDIWFDADTGYPTQIVAAGRQASDGSWSDMPAHLSSEVVVQQLRVITKR
ncbi:MAG: hypothetical protein ABI670_09460 [Chloroflexota bacterium]